MKPKKGDIYIIILSFFKISTFRSITVIIKFINEKA